MLIKATDMKNPWLRPAPSYYPHNITEIQSVDVPDRLAELSSFDSSKLRAVIKYPGTQKTVKVRAKMFLKRKGIDANKS
jgi:hypothetical protein